VSKIRTLSFSLRDGPSWLLFGTAEHAFWLDSADAPTPLARSSFLGTTAGPDRCVLEYDVDRQQVSSHRAQGSSVESGSIFGVIDREVSALSVEPPQLPAGLLGGFVGYLGYECKADCGSPNVHSSDVPDAVLMLANRVVAIDHIARSSDPTEDEANRVELLSDEKTFAEHLMIVDLLRNDLGRVCEVDSVRVPQFMVVEPYTTVHQLISTITGVLDPSRTPTECVRACFPGGSMTGAPKLRTMGIIDDIEREARGVYSGAIGYFGVDGSVDLSIVIRTIVMRPGSTTIGAGGAIVIQSDPNDEFEEILLKARAPMSAVAEAVTGSGAPSSWTVELEPERVGAGGR
jgi:anthranilate/para-aminobenzoate synthase component I